MRYNKKLLQTRASWQNLNINRGPDTKVKYQAILAPTWSKAETRRLGAFSA